MPRRLILWLLVIFITDGKSAEISNTPGCAAANPARPTNFLHRIWAACDFEDRTPDYRWFGPAETNNIPKYPGNATALGVSARGVQRRSSRMELGMACLVPAPSG